MYTIKIINTKKFDRLPYKYAKEAVGLADPKTNVAYVRHLPGMQGIMARVAAHELQELIAKVSPHEEDGIRYKKGRDIIAPIGTALLSAVPGVGPALSALAAAGYSGYKYSKGELENAWQIPLSGLTAYVGSQMMQGMPGYKMGVEASQALGGGWLGQTLTGLQGLTGLTGWGALASGSIPSSAAATSSILGEYVPLSASPEVAAWAGIPSLAETVAPGAFGSIGTALASGGALDILNTDLSQAISPLSNSASEISNALGQATTVTPTTQNNLLQNVATALLGGGTSGTGITSIDNLGKLLMMGSGLAQATAEPPELKYTPQEYVASAKKTMEKYNLTSLPEYAQEEARKMVELPTSGPELDAQVENYVGRTIQDLEASRADQIQTINQRYTQMGATGDTQQAQDIARVNDYVNGQITLARNEARATILAQSYQVKLNALQTVMQTGEFDAKLAFDLASIIGEEDQLRYAIEAEDYAAFQETMSDIFGMSMQQVMQSILQRQYGMV